MGYDHIEHQPSSIIFVNYFKQKDFFLSFDPFTFMSIIASLSGCISVVKKIWGLKFEEWVNGDPFNKYGIAYGLDDLEHADKTQPQLVTYLIQLEEQQIEDTKLMFSKIINYFNK